MFLWVYLLCLIAAIFAVCFYENKQNAISNCCRLTYQLVINDHEASSNDHTDQSIQKLKAFGKSFFLVLSVILFTMFIQLILINLVYLFLAIVAAPVETGSFLLIYISSLFCLLSFSTMTLKALHKTEPWYEFKWFGCCVVSTLLLLALGCGVGVCVAFIYVYSVLTQEYQNDNGIMALISALLPSIAVSSVGVFMTRMLKHLKLHNYTDTQNSD